MATERETSPRNDSCHNQYCQACMKCMVCTIVHHQMYAINCVQL